MKHIQILKIKGFTIVELVITVALLAVMLALAVPNFKSAFQRNALATTSNRIVNSMMLARSEAINRNTSVTMCNIFDATPLVYPLSCTNDGLWETGWRVWVDLDGNGPNDIDQNEEILVEDGLPAGYTLRSRDGVYANIITFDTTGVSTGDLAGGTDVFRLCDEEQDLVRSRDIFVNAVGRVWVSRAAGSVDNCQ